MKILNFPLICLALSLTTMVVCDTLKVGFMTINMEGHDFKSIPDIKRAIGYTANLNNNQRLITSLDQLAKSDADIENLDVILVSVQEGFLVTPEITNIVKELSKDWTCAATLTKEGFIKFNKIRNIESKVCYKTAKFAANYPIESGDLLRSKGVVGNCLQPVNDDDLYCFLATHLNVKVNEGAQNLMEAATKILGLGSAKIKRDFFAFILGDLNTRSNLEKTILDKVLAQPYTSNIESQKRKEGDEFTINKLKGYFNGFAYGSFELNFLGNDDLRNQPYTYKYNGNSDTTYNVEKIKKLKDFDTTSQKVFNLGWLDRLVCLYNYVATDKNCNTKNAVKYFMAPVLKRGDHMPVLGYFEIETVGKSKSQSLKETSKDTNTNSNPTKSRVSPQSKKKLLKKK